MSWTIAASGPSTMRALEELARVLKGPNHCPSDVKAVIASAADVVCDALPPDVFTAITSNGYHVKDGGGSFVSITVAQRPLRI